MKQFLSFALFLLLACGVFATDASAQNALKFLDALQQKQKQADQAAQSESVPEDSIPALTFPAPPADDAAPPDDPFDIEEPLKNVEPVETIEELPLPSPTSPENPESSRPRAPRQSEQPIPVSPSPADASQAFLGAAVEKAGASQLGVKVKNVIADSPAEVAGIRVGDHLITVAGSPVTSEEDLNELLKLLEPGDRIELELMRDRRKSKISATLSAKVAPAGNEADLSTPKGDQSAGVAPKSDPRGPFDVVPIPSDDRFDPRTRTQTAPRPKLGVQLIDASEETGIGLRKRLRTGAGVRSVAADSPAAAAGVPVGALIVGANGRRIEKASDLNGYIATLQPGQALELTYYDDNRLKRSKVVLDGDGVRQAANFQPVPNDDPASGEAVRPVLKGLGKQFPALRRVDSLLDRVSPKTEGAVQPDAAAKENNAADDLAEALREKLRIQQDRNRPLVERFEKRQPLFPRR